MELVAAAKLLQLKNFVVVTEDLVGEFLTNVSVPIGLFSRGNTTHLSIEN